MFEHGLLSAVLLATLWIVIATAVALGPRRFHKRFALTLLALLIPLIPYLWVYANPFVAIMFIAGVGSIMRWPLLYISRMVLRRIGIRIEKDTFEASGYKMTDKKKQG